MAPLSADPLILEASIPNPPAANLAVDRRRCAGSPLSYGGVGLSSGPGGWRWRSWTSETRREIGEQIAGSDLEPAAVARLVAETPEETMRELLTGEIRAAATEQIIRRFPDYVDAERTAEVEAAVGWEIAGGGEVERFLRRLRPRPGERRARARARAAGDAEPRRGRLPAPRDRQRRPGDPVSQRPARALGRRAVRDRDGLVPAHPRRRGRDRAASRRSTRAPSTRPGSPPSSATRPTTPCGGGCGARSAS